MWARTKKDQMGFGHGYKKFKWMGFKSLNMVITWSRNLITWTIYDVCTSEMQENQEGISIFLPKVIQTQVDGIYFITIYWLVCMQNVRTWRILGKCSTRCHLETQSQPKPLYQKPLHELEKSTSKSQHHWSKGIATFFTLEPTSSREWDLDPFVGNTQVDMLAKCGSLNTRYGKCLSSLNGCPSFCCKRISAQSAFQDTKEKCDHLKCGQGQKALELV